MVVCTYGYLRFSFGEEKLVAPLIATPNVDNANRRQKNGKKLNYKLCVIFMQKGIVFVFANYSDNVLVWNYAMSRGSSRRFVKFSNCFNTISE
jgi:hypothetical protein